MGDRANVIFFDDSEVSPRVYLHWHGSDVPAWIEELKELMQPRMGDAAYTTARFVGICHRYLPGYMSLGVHSTDLTLADLKNRTCLEQFSPGDAGVIIVDTRDFSWQAFGGYLTSGRPA